MSFLSSLKQSETHSNKKKRIRPLTLDFAKIRVKSLLFTMVRWNKQKRKEQSERVRKVKPWLNAHGAITPEGKARSKMNAFKHPDDRKTLMIKRFKRLTKASELLLKTWKMYQDGKPIPVEFFIEFEEWAYEFEDLDNEDWIPLKQILNG